MVFFFVFCSVLIWIGAPTIQMVLTFQEQKSHLLTVEEEEKIRKVEERVNVFENAKDPDERKKIRRKIAIEEKSFFIENDKLYAPVIKKEKNYIYASLMFCFFSIMFFLFFRNFIFKNTLTKDK